MRNQNRIAVLSLVAVLLSMLATVLALGVGVEPAHGADGSAERSAVLVIDDNRAAVEGVVFDARNIHPGYRRSFDITVRNDANGVATLTFAGFGFTGRNAEDLRETATVTLTHEGELLGTGGAGSQRLNGATVVIGAGRTTRLTATLAIDKSVGNEAQGQRLHVVFKFQVTGGTAPIEEGVAPDGQPLTGPASVTTLPPTGESLGGFHLLVAATLATLAAMLGCLALAALRPRRDEEEQ